jgi:hypothetical protein
MASAVGNMVPAMLSADSSVDSSQLKFGVNIRIETLTNCPFNHLPLFVKWKTARGDESGATAVREVHRNVCSWGTTFSFVMRLDVNPRTSVLNSSNIRFSVRKVRPGKSHKRIGVAEFDLASVRFFTQLDRILHDGCFFSPSRTIAGGKDEGVHVSTAARRDQQKNQHC